MSKPADFNLMNNRTRECPFACFSTIRRDAPVYYMAELGAYYVSRDEDVRYVKQHHNGNQ